MVLDLLFAEADGLVLCATSACRPIPRAGIVKSLHCAYLSESEKYLRACAHSPATISAIAAWWAPTSARATSHVVCSR